MSTPIVYHLEALKPIIYLAGAIRDGVTEDITWRQEVIERLKTKATILSPLAGKSYDQETKQWRVHDDVVPDADYIVKHDLWMVRRADIVVANLTALASGYPNIGTLVEFGAAAGLGKLIYTLLEAGYTGHQNQTMYRVHPFIERVSAKVFTDKQALYTYLQRQVALIAGHAPEFAGIRG